MDIRRTPDPQSVAHEAAAHIASRITAIISDRAICHLALAGGNTPKATYLLLREMNIDWSHLHIWFSDERCLPLGDPQRNDSMVSNTLLMQLPIPQSQLHPIAAELGADKAARRYARELNSIDHLDIAVLGLGEDGHTASLFPGNDALALTDAAVPVFHAPKPPAERVSLSLQTIRQAGERIIIATGRDKHEPLMRILRGESVPAKEVGEAIWFVDEAAIST